MGEPSFWYRIWNFPDGIDPVYTTTTTTRCTDRRSSEGLLDFEFGEGKS